MILDKGICTVSHKVNTSPAGGKPSFADVAFHWSWYGELNYETAPVRPTGLREEVRADARIRILQNRAINNHDRVELRAANGSGSTLYEVTRAWHGSDPDSGELITDLTLEVIAP